jgi:hypothetical protein
MALIPGHDYVIVTSFRCPHCHTYNGNRNIMIGRYPGSSKLSPCSGCAMEWYPGQAENVTYKD